MKIVSNVLENIEGIQIYYIIGLLIFISFFITVLYRTYTTPNKEVEDIKNSILDDDSDNNLINTEKLN